MIPLIGRTIASNWRGLSTDVWRVGDPDGDLTGKAVVLPASGQAELYLSTDPDVRGPGPTLTLPAPLGHVGPGDVLVVAPDGSRVHVAWKAGATHNSLLLTERCDHYCLMCSQPPKPGDDSYLYERAQRIVTALPPSAAALSLTGGEPTIDPAAFFGLLRHIASVRPDLSTHLLSNGRRFREQAFAEEYTGVGIADLMVGIPLYAAEPALHDYVVQARGAFNETVKGILNLGAVGAAIEIRVVVQKATVPVLVETARFIARNLPFVSQVALMGLEMTGLARPNADLVWVDPIEYRDELREAHDLLTGAGIPTRIYNHQLCVLDRALWPAATQSISDWKNDFPSLCEPCVVKDHCAGVFTTSGARISPHLSPVLADDVPR
jgi:His-Xaa-Ser system radical SAM maturase HxsC